MFPVTNETSDWQPYSGYFSLYPLSTARKKRFIISLVTLHDGLSAKFYARIFFEALLLSSFRNLQNLTWTCNSWGLFSQCLIHVCTWLLTYFMIAVRWQMHGGRGGGVVVVIIVDLIRENRLRPSSETRLRGFHVMSWSINRCDCRWQICFLGDGME